MGSSNNNLTPVRGLQLTSDNSIMISVTSTTNTDYNGAVTAPVLVITGHYTATGLGIWANSYGYSSTSLSPRDGCMSGDTSIYYALVSISTIN